MKTRRSRKSPEFFGPANHWGVVQWGVARLVSAGDRAEIGRRQQEAHQVAAAVARAERAALRGRAGEGAL